MPDTPIRFAAPALTYLNPDDLKRLHEAALRILEKTGARFDDPATIRRLEKHGATTTAGRRTVIPRDLVEWAIRQAPGSITIFDRERNPAMRLEGRNVYFGTGSDCPLLLKPGKKTPQDFSLADIAKAARVADRLENIDFLMSMGQAAEVDTSTVFQEKYRTLLENSSKPQVLTAGTDIRALEDLVEIASALAGSRSALAERPGFLLLVNPTSPLIHSAEALEMLTFMAIQRLPVIYAPGIMAGATGPVTMAGAVAQANAEILAGLVVHQLACPGAPFVFGGGMSPMDMKSGQPTYSAPEAMMAQAALCQLGRDLYGLPTWGFGGCSASKTCDAQAINEAATYNLMAAWMGTNLVHDVGYIDCGMTYSLELLVLCNEFIGQVRRLMGGIVLDDDQLALDVIDRVGPGGAFLTDPHTLQHFRRNWQPELTDRNTRSTWDKRGRKSMGQRAAEKIKTLAAAYSRKALEEKTARAIGDIIERARQR